ncbi:MAG: ATP-binding protein [Cyclobacteriaceae bacterium]
MKTPKIPVNEPQRLRALYHYDILDTPAEKDFDEITQLASRICKKPISLITLLDVNRQWFKSKVGTDVSETPREVAFCAHAIHQDQITEIKDTLEDERFKNNPLVEGDPRLRFYAGMPLITQEGYRLGTLCVIDTEPGELTEDQRFTLKVLSRQVIQQLELRLNVKELRKSVDRVDQQNQELQRLNNISNKLISIISHDLKSPLSTLKGFMDLFVSKGIDKEDTTKFVEGISHLLEGASALLENLLQWGLSQLDGNKLNVKPVLLPALLEDMVNQFKSSVEAKGNTLLTLVPEGYQLMADHNMLDFVLKNLIQNANKFTSEGNIIIKAEQDDDYHYISVSDTGYGMDKLRQEKLFHWDIRQNSIGTSGEKGAGLALLICKEFVERHEGKIRIDSEAGKGATFTISISKALRPSPPDAF